MFHLALFEPEIAPNTGNIIRLCANTGAQLHLIHPLGFRLEDRRLRRAGLDYHEWARVREHRSLEAMLGALGEPRVFAFTTKGRRSYHEVAYRMGDVLLFGPETRGLPAEVLERLPPEQRLRIPMRAGGRSLNLSNSAAVAVYEAWRQTGFSGATGKSP
jgi:tRNA (cytidine/uridine-2'-O-)-methyltransferase